MLRMYVDELSNKFTLHTSDMNAYIKKTTVTLDEQDTKMSEIHFDLLKLKDYVDHFGDNLVLASCQIQVEPSSGFSSRPMTLLDVLKTCHGSFAGIDDSISSHEERIIINKERIETKGSYYIPAT